MFVQIYTNTLLNWKAIDVTLGQQVKTIMYMINSSVDNQLAKLAHNHGWFVFNPFAPEFPQEKYVNPELPGNFCIFLIFELYCYIKSIN